jgi:hypothetical protein
MVWPTAHRTQERQQSHDSTRPMPSRTPRALAPRLRRRLLSLALSLFFACAAQGCGPSAAPVAAPVSEGLPSYTAEEAALFDDTIDLTVFGRVPSIRPAEDPKLPERVLHADSVVLVKIATVTSDRGQATSPFFQLAFKPLAPAFTGSTPTEAVAVTVAPNSPSYQFVVLTDAGLIGRVVVLMFKRYKESGSTVLHWHIESDTKEVREAIERAKLAPPPPRPDQSSGRRPSAGLPDQSSGRRPSAGLPDGGVAPTR